MDCEDGVYLDNQRIVLCYHFLPEHVDRLDSWHAHRDESLGLVQGEAPE